DASGPGALLRLLEKGGRLSGGGIPQEGALDLEWASPVAGRKGAKGEIKVRFRVKVSDWDQLNHLKDLLENGMGPPPPLQLEGRR
ncbi:MAG: hypothetical protein D6729_04425, partial [Deltaproteobacteria bacterium]